MSTGSVSMYRRTCRRVGLDRNPLRRGEDRLQTGVAALLALVFLVVVPVLAVTVGGTVYRVETAAVQAETARLHQVRATVIETGKAPLYAPVVPARVSWKDAEGGTHTADYQSTKVVEPGSTVSIWLNDGGAIVEPPSSTQAAGKAVLLTAGALLGVSVVLGGSYWLVRRGLDRRRLRRWESEWLVADLTWGHG
ncbi:Rv1733c family protein [Nocardia amamiensis]|uniref:Rv1733c family protein n=1 Tax=Nocardia amamiensis TaxID=404578 RepID=UPI0033E64F05